MEMKIKLMLGQAKSLFSIPGVIIAVYALSCALKVSMTALLHVYLSKQFSVSFRSAHMRGLVPATNPLKCLHKRDCLQGLVPQTVKNTSF